MLKAGSKQTTGVKKRKTVPLLGTFKEYTESKKKPEPPRQQKQLTDVLMMAPNPAADPSAKEDLRKKN